MPRSWNTTEVGQAVSHLSATVPVHELHAFGNVAAAAHAGRVFVAHQVEAPQGCWLVSGGATLGSAGAAAGGG